MPKRGHDEDVYDPPQHSPPKKLLLGEQYADRLRPRGRQVPRRRPHLPLPVQNQVGYFRGIHLRALPTDIDLRCRWDISIADKRQQARIKKRHKCLHKNCKTCLRPKHPIACVNFPCGHMTNCLDCAPHMTKCTHCYKRIDFALPCPVFDYPGNYCFLDWFDTARAIIP